MEQNAGHGLAEQAFDAKGSHAQINALRRHQRRLLYWGGGLLSFLIALAAFASALASIGDFHAREAQVFQEGRDTIDEFLTQRDRAYANSLHTNNALWAQTQLLREWGRPFLADFQSNGEATTVIAPGDSVPWLVMGDNADEKLGDNLSAYLGMLEQYSAYTKASVSAMQSKGPLLVYGYDPSGSLMAITGVADEASILRDLKVTMRKEAIARLMISDQRWQSARRCLHTDDPSIPADKLIYYFDRNPFNGEPSLVTVMSLTAKNQPYFTRVTFESMDILKSRLEQATHEAFAIASPDGSILLRTGDMPVDLQISSIDLKNVQPDAKSPIRFRRGTTYFIAMSLHGVDWIAIHSYSFQAILAAKGASLLATIVVTFLILAALWTLLLRMERCVFEPALADASRVYESDALNRAIVQTSPIGLALLDRHTYRPVMQNGVASQIMMGNQEKLDVLYEAMCAESHGMDEGSR